MLRGYVTCFDIMGGFSFFELIFVVLLIFGSISFSCMVLNYRIHACLFQCVGFLQLYSQEAKPSAEDFGAWIQRDVQRCRHGLVSRSISLSAREP